VRDRKAFRMTRGLLRLSRRRDLFQVDVDGAAAGGQPR
jgi:hypothetical protein